MNVLRCVLALGLILTLPSKGRSQEIPTEIICQWREGTGYAKALPAAQSERWLADNISVLEFPDVEAAKRGLKQLRGLPGLVAVQYNYRVSFRAVPNDPEYFRQANMQRAGFESAWQLTTGGKTAEGHAIVTAVLDGGFDTRHDDLAENIWTNTAEIPSDGIDNDGNGYVDDQNGWNFVDNSPDHPTDTHGTAVAGLIGARGNNALGVSGSNWEAQLMLFTIFTVADIIAAYQYVIDQRTLFNRSGGSRGAFVVATNASFGIEGATCDEFPVWGEMYDRLGDVGVLTAASVANVNRDADRAGDMPVDCPSDFLLGVTNVDDDDRLFSSSGYGRVNVDLAAPGERSYTTRPDNGFGNFGSTSAAAPYVTGTVALLYSLPTCTDLPGLSRNEPSGVARRVREAILSSVRPGLDLADRTVTGGIIDAGAALQYLEKACTTPPQPPIIQRVYPNPSSGTVQVVTNLSALPSDMLVEVVDPLGRVVGMPPYRELPGEPGAFVLDLPDMPTGYYIIVVKSGNNTAHANLLHR